MQMAVLLYPSRVPIRQPPDRGHGQLTGFAQGLRAVSLLDGSHGAVEFAPFAGGQANRPLRWKMDLAFIG
jgi:hypothetical protein